MKKYLLFASAILAFASCANDSYLGTEDEKHIADGDQAITFGFDVPTPTRAEGAAAATKLNNQFIVWGEKGEATTGAVHTEDDAGANTHQLVFPNYKVTYTANTANSTTSNTKDWEYVGFKFDDASATIPTTSYSTNITPNSGADVVQTIKYWDYAATSYTFTAVSAKPADISDGKVKINKLTSGSTVYDKGYEVTVTAAADLTSLYFADRVNIAKSNGKDRTEPNQYGGNVKFTFRNGVSQVRVGMYETIPGYEVKVTKFYYDSDANAADATKPAFDDMTDGSTTNFVANVPNTATGVAGKFTVKYYPQSRENDAAKITNHPTISFAPTTAADSKQYITLGNQITAATSLGVTSTAATYDKADGTDPDTEPDFTSVFPQETNNKSLKLKIDYQLSNSVTGEIINITGKTAEIPAQHLQWKPNFKYTYLFKITDDDLYPITFDAITIEAEDGTAEYITTVTEPSITTFGAVYDGSKYTSYQTDKNEYQAQTDPNQLDIFATIVLGSAVQTPTLATNVNVYSVDYKAGATDAEKAEKPITEGSVAESIANPSNNIITCTLANTDATTYFKAVPAPVTSVPAEDGSTITINALKLTGVKAGIYAVEFIYNTDKKAYKVIKVVN